MPFGAGGPTDTQARWVAQKLNAAFGQTVIVDNRPAAGGVPGTAAVAKAAPDGYTFCGCSIGPLTIPSTEKLPYDPLADLVPVSLLNTNPMILLVNPNVKANNVKELVALAKANPTALNYSSSGLGGLMYFSAELFKSRTGAPMTHVPYRGGAPATAAVISGEVQLVFTNMSDAVGQIEGGKVRALAVTTSKRSSAAPKVPTLAEEGVPNFHTESWNGVFAPKGTPKEIVGRLNNALTSSLADGNTRKRLLDLGGVLPTKAEQTPEWLGEFVKKEVARWTPILKGAAGDK